MLPEAFLERMKRQLGDEYESYLDSLNRPRAVALRFNPLKGEIPQLPFVGQPVPWEPMGYYYDPDARPGLHVFHEAGVYYLQEASAMAPVALLDPKPGERVCDLCAAPGGKSRMCADLVLRSAGFDRSACSNSLLVSVDLPGPRMEKLSENLSKIDFIKSHSIASDLVSGSLAGELEKRGLPTLFNRVLLDAPCSNTGVLRRRPDARYRLEEEDISSCSELQKTLMAKAAKFTSRGGSFVYSTCSIEREENSENAEWFTGNFPDFELVQSKICIPGAFNDGGGSFLFKRRS